MFEKIKNWFHNSLTIFLTYLVGLLSLILENIELFVSADLKNQLLEAGFDPVTAGRVGLALSILTFFARMRSLRKSQ